MGFEDLSLAVGLAAAAGMSPFIALALLGMALGIGFGTEGFPARDALSSLAGLLAILALLAIDLVLDKLPALRSFWTPVGWVARALVGAACGWALLDGGALAPLVGALLALAINWLRLELADMAGVRVPALGRFGALAGADFAAAVGGALSLAAPLLGVALAAIGLAGTGHMVSRRWRRRGVRDTSV